MSFLFFEMQLGHISLMNIPCYVVDGDPCRFLVPEFIGAALRDYVAVIKQEIPQVTEFIQNLSFGLAPDGRSAVNYGFYSLPALSELPTKKHEDDFMRDTANEIGDAFLYIFNTSVYLGVYKHQLGGERFWKKLMDGKTNGYFDFIRTANVQAIASDCFSKWLGEVDSGELTTRLYSNERCQVKYR